MNHMCLVVVSFQTLDKNETMNLDNLDLGVAPRFVYNIITLQFSSKSHEQARSDDEPNARLYKWHQIGLQQMKHK